jgi:hypothetical protein
MIRGKSRPRTARLPLLAAGWHGLHSRRVHGAFLAGDEVAMYVIEALSMGRPLMFERANGEKQALKLAEQMRAAFMPREGRELVVRGPEALLAWWSARASAWQALNTPDVT